MILDADDEPCFRGEVYYAVLGCGIGSEQAGIRPVVILQNDTGNKFSPTNIIAPISGQIATKAQIPMHYCLEPQAGLLKPSMVLLEQIRTIDKQRLGRRLGRLSEEHIRGINQAIKISLDMVESHKKWFYACAVLVPTSFTVQGLMPCGAWTPCRRKRNCVHTVTGVGASIMN